MQKKKTFFWLRSFSAIIDLAIIYSLYIILSFVIRKYTFVGPSLLYIGLFLLYYIYCGWRRNGQTFAKSLTGLQVTYNSTNHLSVKNVLVRELILKGIAGIAVPFYFIELFFPVWSPIFSILSLALLLVFSLLLLLLLKRPWLELLSGTYTRKVPVNKQLLNRVFIALSTLFITALFIVLYPFLIEKKDFSNNGFPSYPVTAETNQYTAYIKDHSRNPADYVFDLFKKQDIVVLSERLHTEYTQYELITAIVSDKRFINEVGNIFTECGSVSFQDTLETYLHTTFLTEEDLDKNTAILQRNSNAIWPLWTNTNLFDLFKTVNGLNSHLPDSTKINWHFTDLPVDWQTMSHEKHLNAYSNPLRDSIMADHIIKQYTQTIAKQKRHKALVIMNTRHGYGYSERIKQYTGTTAFLMRAFPGNVANVLINTVSLKYGILFTPVQHGKWETAFAQAGNPATGFDFSGSPFGEDPFDAAFLSAAGVKYKDLFTGFIFYKPLEAHFSREGFPYAFDHFEDSLLKRAAYVSPSFARQFKRSIDESKIHPENAIQTIPTGYYFLYNLFTGLLVPAFLFTGFLIAIIFYVKQKIQINRYNTPASKIEENPFFQG